METTARRRGRPRNEERLAQREHEILDAAVRLFASRGYAETDMDSVAHELGLAKGTLYRYFPSKRDLFQAALNRGMAGLTEAVDERCAPVLDPVERMVQAIYAFLAYFETPPELADLFVQELGHFKDQARPAYFAHHEANCGPWKAMFEQLLADGRVRDIPAEDDHSPMLDLLFGTVLANRFTARKSSHRAQARAIVDLFFHGLLSDSERERRRQMERPR
ncbi:MAG: TetR/AcrR family transcriptional regulator [Planctomycetaceae bacterium]|nr:TetR/AcrR family transcriptional regulator [Planctomycetaceae bacterium]